MTEAEVKEAMRQGKINLKWRPCPTDADLQEIYIKQTNEVVFIGTSKESTRYCTEIMFGKGGALPKASTN